MDSTIDIRNWPEPKQVAQFLGLKDAWTVIRMARRGRLRGVVYGGGSIRQRMKIDPASVTEFKAWEKTP